MAIVSVKADRDSGESGTYVNVRHAPGEVYLYLPVSTCVLSMLHRLLPLLLHYVGHAFRERNKSMLKTPDVCSEQICLGSHA